MRILSPTFRVVGLGLVGTLLFLLLGGVVPIYGQDAASEAGWSLYLEAEGGVLTFPMTRMTASDASACAYVASSVGENGSTTLTFSLAQSRRVYLWGRTRAPHSGANSLYVSIDGKPEMRWDYPVGMTWTWNRVRDALTGLAPYYDLPAGIHTIRVRSREADSPLDALALTEDGSSAPSYVGPCGPTSTPPAFPTSSDTPPPTNSATTGPTFTETSTSTATATRTHTPTFTPSPGILYLEIESGILTAPMQAVDDPSASSCRYIMSPVGNSGVATLNFSVVQSGTYWLFGRTRAPHSGANSLFISVDNGTEFRWDFAVSSGWQWTPVRDANTGIQSSFALNAGPHTLRIRAREGYSPVDVMALTGDRNATITYFVPCGETATPTPTLSLTPSSVPSSTPTVGLTPTPTLTPSVTSTVMGTATETPTPTRTASPMTTDVYYFEAEHGQVEPPMTIASDPLASACHFVRSSAGNSGSITIAFVAPQAGTYYLWGRARADHSGMNSFFVAVDGGAEVRWDFPVGASWSWNPVRDALTGARPAYSLSAGTHQIRFRAREQDSPLDSIAITRHTSLVPDYVAACGTPTHTATVTVTASPTQTPTATSTVVPTSSSTVGLSPTFTPTRPVSASATPFGVTRVEPEYAETIMTPMTVGEDAGASGCAYVYSPTGRDAAGYFVTRFHVPMPGTYGIWGRVRTPHSGANAFFVSIDAEPEFTWAPPVYTTWTWAQVRDQDRGNTPRYYFLTQGVHYVWVRTREAMSQLDALEFIYLGPGQSHTPAAVAPCGAPTFTSTPTPTFTRTSTPTAVPFTQTLILQKGTNGYNNVEDTYIDVDNPTMNFGTSPSLYLEGFNKAQILIRYDLSQLPSSARVVSATLGIYVIPDARLERRQPLTSTVYSLTRSWSESQATWMQARAGNPWGVPGAYDPYSDYATWPNNEIWFYEGVPQGEYSERWYTYTVTSLVQNWIDHPDTNFGFVIKSHWPHEITYQIRSSNYWSAAFRPRLQVIYYPGP